MSSIIMRLVVISLLLVVPACSKSTTPEQRVREFLEHAEQAAEKKDTRALCGYVSDRYADAEGRDRRTIDAILRLYVLRHESIHLLTRIESIEFQKPTQAQVVIYVAMAARPISDAAQLATYRADLYRFVLGIVDEDSEWRVRRADWRPAEATDFIR